MKRASFLNIARVGNTSKLDWQSASYPVLLRNFKDYKEWTVDSAYAQSLKLISYLHYNDISYWWILGMFNGIIDPRKDLPIGTVLKIPNMERLLTDLKTAEEVTKTNTVVEV